jgi:hypothetical protein
MSTKADEVSIHAVSPLSTLGWVAAGALAWGASSGLAAADEVAAGDIVCCAPAGTTTIQQAVNTRARM